MTKLLLNLALIMVLVACNTHEKATIEETKPQETSFGKFTVEDAEFYTLIDSNAVIEMIDSGYNWSEGPLWLEKEQKLIWSDVPENTIFEWTESGGVKVYLKPSGNTSENPALEGSNGLLLDLEGNLLLCQHGDRRMAKMNAPISDPKPEYTTLSATYNGKKLNSPNDAAYGPGGNLYLTDPPYGLPGQDSDPNKELDFQGVYKLSPDGVVTLMVDSLSKPNGIAFSPDNSKCYVANSDPDRAIWMVYDLDENQNFTNGKVFFDATEWTRTRKGLPDGLKVHPNGTIFGTGPGGVLVFSPEGKLLGTIETGEAIANCCFDTDHKTLFMTSDMYVVKMKLK
jgi:gluconolactonase